MVFRLNKTVSASYGHLATIFFVMATLLTLVRGIFHDVFGEQYLIYLVPLFLPVGVLFFFFMVRLIKNLGVNDRFIRFILGLLASAIILRLVTVLILDDPQIKFVFSFISSTMLLLMQSICVYFMSVNLFIEENPIKEKLWASVCVYFMIGATFGTLYSLVLTIDPAALGFVLSRPVDVYIMGLVYSLNVVSGLDAVYDQASETIRMTAVLESIFTMLFMVILIGRLLGSKD